MLPHHRFHSILAAIALCALVSACAGPRMKRLDTAEYPRRPSIYPIEVYSGQVNQSYRDIAIIESTAYADDTDPNRVAQIEELKKKARRLGADAIQQIRVLTKQVKGFTADERTPFPSVKQGSFPLYFMRAEAIIFESSLPGSVARGNGFAMKNSEEELKPPPASTPEPTPVPDDKTPSTRKSKRGR